MPETNKLTNVHAHEVSLVRRGANGKRFALTKGLTMNELIEAVLKTEAEGEADMVAALGEGVSEEQVELAKANFRLQVGFQDKLPKEAFAEIAKSSYGIESASEAPNAEPAPEPEPEPIPAEVQKTIDAKDAELVDLRKRTEELEKTALRKSLTETVEKEFKHVAGSSTDEMVDLLMDLTSAGGDLADRVKKTWKAVDHSALLETKGTVKKNDGTGSAFEQIQKAAAELQKSDSGLSEAQAIAQVAKQQPELHRAYKEEKRG